MIKRTALIAVLFFGLLLGSAKAAQPFYEAGATEALQTLGISDRVCIVLFDVTGNEVVYEQNSDKRVNTASTAKLLTCIVALENCSMDETVTISKSAVRRTGSTLELIEGEQVTLYDLLSGMMVASGNDAAQAVAEYISGSQKKFAVLMNEAAIRIGMSSSHFTNSIGNSDKDNYSTAKDMTELAKYALGSELLCEMVRRSSYVMPDTNMQLSREVYSTNLMLYPESEFFYKYAVGLKTGSSHIGHGNLVAAAEKDGIKLVCIVMNDRSKDYTDRWEIAKALFEYGFSRYTVIDVEKLLSGKTQFDIMIGTTGCAVECETESMQGKMLTVMNEQAAKILSGEISADIDTEDITLPVKKGDFLGKATYICSDTGNVICTADLLAAESIYQKDFPINEALETAIPEYEADKIPETGDTNALSFIQTAGIILIICLLVLFLSYFTVRKIRRKAKF